MRASTPFRAPFLDEATGHSAGAVSAFRAHNKTAPQHRRPYSTDGDLPALRGTHPVRAVLGAQFRGPSRIAIEPVVQCASCAAMNSKVHRAKVDSAECRLRLDETMEQSERHAARIVELEGQLGFARDELAVRTRQLLDARETAAAARASDDSVAATAATAAAEWEQEREGLLAEAASLRSNISTLEARLALTEADAAHRVAQLSERSAAAAAAMDAAERERRTEAAQAAAEAERAQAEAREQQGRRSAAEAAQSMAAARAERERSERADVQRELERVRVELAAQEKLRTAAHAELATRQGELAAMARELEEVRFEFDEIRRRNDAERLSSSKLAGAVARAQEAEGERAHTETVLRERAERAEASAERRAREAEELRAELEGARREADEAATRHKEDALAQQECSEHGMREILSAIKIAVLAPCLKLHITGGEQVHAGSPEQVDLKQIGAMLEASVLRRYSKVALLDERMPLDGGAQAIFPELKATMAHVQREVRERLMAMMACAGEDQARESTPMASSHPSGMGERFSAMPREWSQGTK